MLRRATTTVIAAAALIVGVAAPANALVFGDMAGDQAERDAVVRIHLEAEGGIAECTGTVVEEQWVLTAQHCIEGLNREGGIAGVVTTGEGALGSESVNTFKVNTAVSALDSGAHLGDVALLHVTEPMNVAPVEINYSHLGAGTVADAYGWSTLGTGATGQLPHTTVTVEDSADHLLYTESQAYVTTSNRPAQLQQGDSGGPIFVDGEVAGVLSVGIGSLFNPVLISGTYMHAKMEGLQQWVDGYTQNDPEDEYRDIGDIPAGGIGSLIPQLPVVPGAAEIEEIVGVGAL